MYGNLTLSAKTKTIETRDLKKNYEKCTQKNVFFRKKIFIDSIYSTVKPLLADPSVSEPPPLPDHLGRDGHFCSAKWTTEDRSCRIR